MTDKPWSERIPAAIADGEKLLDGGEYMLIPPHIGGNDTKLTLVLTAGEVEMAYALYNATKPHADGCRCNSKCVPLIAFTLKIEKVKHD